MITLYSKLCDCIYPSDILYPSDTLYPEDPLVLHSGRFTHNGYGVLRDFKANPQITEAINGEYSIEFEYAKDGWLSDYLIEENILRASNNGSDQLFRIYYTDKSLENIKVLAKHIAFDLNDNLLDDVYPVSKNGTDALNWVLDRTQFIHGFTGWSDITTEHSARYVRKNMNDVFFNADNSFLNVWGGEFQFDNFTIKLYEQRGADNGLQIRHGKNLQGANVKLDFSTVATRIMPVGKNGLLLPEVYIDSTLIDNYHSPIIRVIDFDIGVDEDTTASEAYDLIRAEVAKLYANGIDLPSISAKIDFIELSKVKEYEIYSSLETASIGDTVKVYIEQLNIDLDARIVKTTYDCLKERFVQLELGEITPNYVTQASSVELTINQAITTRAKKNEIISTINQSDEAISISADRLDFTAHTFNIDTDEMVFQVGSTEIINSNGLLTGLSFDSKNVMWTPYTLVGYGFLGYQVGPSSAIANWLEIDAEIPTNFIVQSAYITLYHIPVTWDTSTGYCRNLKLYNVSNPTNLDITGIYNSEFDTTYNYTETEITNAFGASGYTGSSTTGEVEVSANLASNFTGGNIYKLTIHSSDATPTFNPGVDNPNTILGIKTGYVYAVLNITGYYSYS